jgi:hypothetical protein
MCQQVAIRGHVDQGKAFQRDIGEGLFFAMIPENVAGDGFKYSIESSAEPGNFASITPPYHFGDATYFGAGWGLMSQDIVRSSGWHFNFIASSKQWPDASEALTNFIWPGADDPNREKAKKVLRTFPVGEGWFTNLRFKIRAGTASRDDTSGKGDYGDILSIGFTVHLVFPKGFQVDPSLKPVAAGCKKRGSWLD